MSENRPHLRMPVVVLAGVLGILASLALAFLVIRTWAVPDARQPCQPNGGESCSSIDGFPIGRRITDCPASEDACNSIDIEHATQALDERNPGHPPVVAISTYGLDMTRVCGPRLCALSGGAWIVVFTLAAGPPHAIEINCPGVASCAPVASYPH